MTCAEAIQAYAFRAIGFGERLLPRTDIGVCEQVVLIGSGMIWNIYFAVLALGLGFFFAVALAVAKASPNLALRKPAEWFIFVFRGSPLFIQFFMAYEAFVLLPRIGVEFELFGVAIEAETRWFARAWLGALIVLWLNTSAYSAEIFYGALRSVPKGDLEAADAYGLTGWKKFRRITFPTTMRLAWPAYTNEAIFLFHSTALVFFSSFPAFQQRGDALYYANYFADRTFNPFIPYPIVAIYFVLFTLLIIWLFGAINTRLNRHLPQEVAPAPALPPAGHPMSWLDEHPEITSIRTVAADLNGQPRGKRDRAALCRQGAGRRHAVPLLGPEPRHLGRGYRGQPPGLPRGRSRWRAPADRARVSSGAVALLAHRAPADLDVPRGRATL
jgi:polar amino acid transport system permease protein